jgi:putative ABC transport system ATP-binding protein
LDGENGHAIMSLLADIAKDASRGVLVVTHDPRILPFADRVLRIEYGRIVGDERASAKTASADEANVGIYDYAEI